MYMINSVFDFVRGQELLGILNFPFHSNCLENVACFFHLELLNKQFFLQFAIVFPCGYQYVTF